MKLAIFGASGFAREVRDIAFILGYKEIIFIDKANGESHNVLKIVSEEDVYKLAKEKYRFTIGIGNPKIRMEISERFSDLEYVNLIHPAATFGFDQLAKIKNTVGNIICAGTRVTNNVKLGNFGIYYLNCTVAHDCIIEDYVTIASGANISGNVKLSKGSYIGTNACILQGNSITEKMVIGKNSIVGAGSVVTKKVPDNKIVKGIPAK
ncbi:hypothetical protein BKP37_05930 [Anaerobacillus alkalilacustris]|uniref:PglD N-terminal domain-containing protein n=1 Tax=Anaerobacillus alkalilacustris TaxID=393763 RepID=A0A1S2LW38_9BACI|nr:NeuD/PglB/VioB family sugar acetyltransferase [Anaerobacillus alkalilacustris]OIJ16762.1 hypothetical protein BKP37_05930 [Anaerobacillus alkalilacustris]